MSGMPKNEWVKPVELAFRMSAWLVGPIIFALLVGNWLDEKYHSQPKMFLIATGVAFAITCFGLVREVKEYFKKIEKELEK